MRACVRACVCACVRACALSHFSHVQLFVTLWTVAHQDSSVHGMLQARILEWVAMPSSRGSSQAGDQTRVSYVSCIGRQVLSTSATWEAQQISGHARTLLNVLAYVCSC